MISSLLDMIHPLRGNINDILSTIPEPSTKDNINDILCIIPVPSTKV